MATVQPSGGEPDRSTGCGDVAQGRSGPRRPGAPRRVAARASRSALARRVGLRFRGQPRRSCSARRAPRDTDVPDSEASTAGRPRRPRWSRRNTVKRTYQPNVRRRAKKHGFRHRMSDPRRPRRPAVPPAQGPSAAVGLIWRIRDRRTFVELRRRGRRARHGCVSVTYLPPPSRRSRSRPARGVRHRHARSGRRSCATGCDAGCGPHLPSRAGRRRPRSAAGCRTCVTAAARGAWPETGRDELLDRRSTGACERPRRRGVPMTATVRAERRGPHSLPGRAAARRRSAAYQYAFAWRPSPCRYVPTCSTYALEALEVHGASGARGSRSAASAAATPGVATAGIPVPPQRKPPPDPRS